MRGVAVFIRSGLDIVIQHEQSDSNGRLIMLSKKIKDKKHFLINLCLFVVRIKCRIALRGVYLDSDSNVILQVDMVETQLIIP